MEPDLRRMRARLAARLLVAAALLALPPSLPAAERKPPPPPEQAYAERVQRLAAAPKPRVKDWLDLADFCERSLLFDRREQALRRALELEPDHARARARLDEARFQDAWIPLAECFAREAAAQPAGHVYHGARWLPAAKATAEREADRKRVGWPCALRVDTRHARIYSDEDPGVTREVGALLEQTGAAYQQVYGRIWKQREVPPITVYLFRSQATFRGTYQRVLGKGMPDMTDGRFAGDILWICSDAPPLPFRSRVHGTAVHEMGHAMDALWSNRVLAGAPAWLHEGRAEYLRWGRRGFQVLPGSCAIATAPGEVASLRRGLEQIPLARLLELEDVDQAGYQLSFALVHYLHHGQGGALDAGFRRFLAGAPARTGARELVAQLGVELPRLEQDLRAYATAAFLADPPPAGR